MADGAGNKKSAAGTLPAAVCIIASLVMVVCLFLPWASTSGSMRSYLQSNASTVSDSTYGLTYGEMADMSLVDYAKAYLNGAGSSSGHNAQDSQLYAGVIIALFVVITLTLLFSWRRNATGAFLFSLLSLGITELLIWDFEDRGIVPSSGLDWDMASTILPIAAIVVACAAFVLFIAKKRAKSQAKRVAKATAKENQ